MPSTPRFAAQKRVPLPGSEKQPFAPTPLASVTASSATGGSGRGTISVSVLVCPKERIDTASLGTPGARMTRAEFARRHGPKPDSVRLVKAFATEFGLTVATDGPAGRCTLTVSGSQAAMAKAFGVTLTQERGEGTTFRVRQGAIMLPEGLIGHVDAVLGLDNRPQAQPHNRLATPRATNVSYTPVQVAQAYGLAAGASAKGQTIGIIELGGGFRAKDITAYFKTLNLAAPKVVAVSVDKGKNAPSTAAGADGEVMLDIEVCGAVATGAKIAVYFAPNTDQGFTDAISTAVHDTVNKPSVLSISWGGPESSWTGQAMNALDAACQAAAAVGVTITAASGDNGSGDGVASGDHVDFPASSPHVLACGGTKLLIANGSIASEVVWNEVALNEGATGGGVSAVFAMPSWQSSANVPRPGGGGGGRGVPDVAGDADPATGYVVRVDGQTQVIGGTSAVAPLWAGIVAVSNALNKTTAGFANPTLYGGGAKAAFRDITQGNNGTFSSGPGWDACTGLGSPVVPAVIKALAATAPVKKAALKKAPKKAVKKSAK